MTSCYHASTPIRGSWLQTNKPEHESADRAGDPVTCVLPMKTKRHCSGKIYHHLSLYCDWVKPKLQDETEIVVSVRVLWDMINIFTDNFGIVSSNMHCAVAILIPLK